MIARSIYRIFIEPRSADQSARRRELIFNIIASFLFAVAILLDLSVLFADASSAEHVFTISVCVAFLGGLVLLSRTGHFETASYLFIGLYFLATTWGEAAWGVSMPLALLSYGAIIVMANVIFGTRTGLAAATAIIVALYSIAYLEAHGVTATGAGVKIAPLDQKDVIESSFILAIIAFISWLSNRETERSLARAERSERALKEERDLLEMKIDERTRELKRAEVEKVSQLYRFIEFGRLASGIFHDLLNPLTAVSLSIEKLSEKNGADPKAGADAEIETRECIARAIKASKRMESFMQTARKQLDCRERVQAFSAARELADAVDLLVHKSKSQSVEVRLEPGTKDVLIRGNPVKFFQVAVNLISNAIDSYDGDCRCDERMVRVSLSTARCEAVLAIEDRGCGIEKSLHKTIFDPFFTTKRETARREAGIGLGLSTTKDIVEKDFGGRIELSSAKGAGSKFTVFIRLEPEGSGQEKTPRCGASLETVSNGARD